jgi:PHD/YefM family antitoxin component YafN of YafNO toxin-antitoxin module
VPPGVNPDARIGQNRRDEFVMTFVMTSEAACSAMPSERATTVCDAMPERSAAAVRVANDELATVREAMRELNRLVEALESGELEKVVLTQRNRMRAVVLSVERFSELERQREDASRRRPTVRTGCEDPAH